MPRAELHVLRLVTGELQENCFLLWKTPAPDAPETGAVVFDPGADAAEIRAALDARRLRPAAFLLTHCHGDHIGALAELKQAFPEAPVAVHEAEARWLSDPLRNLSYFLGANITAPAAERTFTGGETLAYAGLSLKALHVPGHSPGGTAYYAADPAGPAHLFCGDILFQGGIGRTDFPGSEGEDALIAGIRKTLFVLPDETLVHTGHGPDTTIGAEKISNPFCGLV